MTANKFLIQTLATFKDANYKYTLSLDGNLYVISFVWNVRGEFWSISLYTDDLEQTIIESQKLVLNMNLLTYSYNKYKPLGVLIATSSMTDEITFDNLGQDVELQYITQS